METAAARAELERLKQGLRAQGIDGLEWIPIPVEADGGGAGVATSLIAAAPVGATDRLRTLVGEILDRCPWSSIPAIRLYPESARGRVVLRADVLVFDVAETLTSEAGRAAIADGEPPDAVGQRVWQVLADRITAAGFVLAERQDRLRTAFSAANMAYGGDRGETLAYALEGLGEGAEALARDLILLTRRENDHARIVEDLEAALENEVPAPGGKLEGRLFSHGAWAPPPRTTGGRPWGDDPSMGGGDSLPDLAPVPEVGDRAERIAQLGAVVEDAQALEGVRLDALRALAAIDDPEARAWRIRALGHSEIFLNALHGAPLGEALPLFREIVVSRDDRRIAAALVLLRRFGRDGLDAAESIWRAAAEQAVTDVDVRMASLHRESLIDRYGETGDASVVDALVRELPERAGEAMWIGAACRLFVQLGVEARAAPAVLAMLATHSGDGPSHYAMELFATFRCDEAVPFLRRGLDAPPVWRGAAVRGLAAQGEAGRAEVLAWMERQIAAVDAESRDEDVATALEALGRSAEPAPDVIERAAAAGPLSASAAQWVRKRYERAAAPAVIGDPAKEESSLVGSTPEETAALRFGLWLSKGYATRRYQQSGHRSPEWDGDVIEAHDAYAGAAPHPGAHPAIGAAYDRAIAKGCQDAMVLYRAGACASHRGDEATAQRRIAQAIERLPERYPDAPYLSAGAAALARFAQTAGRMADAIAWARKAAAFPAREPGATALLASLEDIAGMSEVSSRLPDLAVGSARPAAGQKHAHPVTGLAVNESAEPVVASADAGGFVQLAIAAGHAAGSRLIPIRRERLHAAGRTVVAWATEHRLLSAGADRLVKEIDATEPRAFAVVREHRVDVPVTAFAALSSRAMALGDAAGRVFAIEREGKDAPRLVAQLRLKEIRRIVAWPGEDGFAAADAEGRVAIVDSRGPRLVDLSVPVRPDAIAFVPSGMLLCYGGGSAIFVDPRSGQVADEMPPDGEEPLVVRFESGGGHDFAVFENGTATVRSGRGLRYAGRDPLAVAEASWSRGVLVMATRAGWLRTADFADA